MIRNFLRVAVNLVKSLATAFITPIAKNLAKLLKVKVPIGQVLERRVKILNLTITIVKRLCMSMKTCILDVAVVFRVLTLIPSNRYLLRPVLILRKISTIPTRLSSVWKNQNIGKRPFSINRMKI